MDSQNDTHQSSGFLLYEVVDPINDTIKYRTNKKSEFKYGYDPKHDIVVISKTGKIGEIYDIQGLKVALPEQPKKIYSRSKDPKEQYWEPFEYPEELAKIKDMFEWHEYPEEFKEKWEPYIEEEFKRRSEGFWFMNNGVPTWLPPKHYMYLQWQKIDVGYPEFREANRIFFIHWHGCVADNRCYGNSYLKIRRSGFSNMAVADTIDEATQTYNARFGILSKSNADAKSMFTSKLVPMAHKLPFFFKPLQEGMDKPKSELSYAVPSERITKKKLLNRTNQEAKDEVQSLRGLDTSIDFKSTDDNSYDGEKLKRLIHDESFKWTRPANILNNWKVTKTCLRLGKKIIGKCMMGSTANALDKGGAEGKEIYYGSKIERRGKNGQTPTGLYSLFIPMEWNTEGFIDIYGMPVMHNPEEPVMGSDGEWITQGAVEWWEDELDSLKDNPVLMNEFYRQFPRTEEHAFRDDAKTSLFNINKIYEQIDFNGDDPLRDGMYMRGNFAWEGGIKDSRVVWNPDPRNGRFEVSWIPPHELQNMITTRNGMKYPANDHLGAFGCDPYDISGTADKRGSKGSAHGRCGFHMDNRAPVNQFFLRYNARPPMAEIFFEDILMAIVFYGMPILVENNRPRLLYHLKKRGYRGYSINNPMKLEGKLSAFERECGGVPNNSEDMIQAHAAAIESEITKHIGRRSDGSMGSMPFNKTLEDWVRFDIRKRGLFDDSISSGLAIMACQRLMYRPTSERKEVKINLGIKTYSQEGNTSQIKQ